jgi:hypothetical protein
MGKAVKMKPSDITNGARFARAGAGQRGSRRRFAAIHRSKRIA